MKSKIIFCDTNIVFALFLRIATNQEYTNSALIHATRFFDIYISEKVIRELEKNFIKKFDIYITDDDIQKCLDISHIYVIQSNILREEMKSFVNDEDDAYILQDAVDIQADFLITKNMRDFHIPDIVETFGINIINVLPPMPEF